ncbi:hypothetical protein Taro_009571 [Colocasia esculenta]|uniref:Uncharacterized protein n=1 Tax=Colocasia esculenta TaxID=4460 RepID=A0A843U4D8_COLES|nr:hypothetical protein [Colocasia esculenta]
MRRGIRPRFRPARTPKRRADPRGQLMGQRLNHVGAFGRLSDGRIAHAQRDTRLKQNAAGKKLRVGAVSSSLGCSRPPSHDPNNERVLELAGIVWRSSWWLGSRRSSTPSRSSSPVSSAATCTDHHLEDDQRHGVDTSMGCVDTTFAKYCMSWVSPNPETYILFSIPTL